MKRNTSNKVLIALSVFIFFFIVTMIITYWKFQMVPDTLIQYTLGAGGVECFVLASIKISKVIKGEKTEEDDDGV